MKITIDSIISNMILASGCYKNIKECVELHKANLWGASLGGVNLEGANLGGANLWEANLGGANLRGANLEGANLEVANLEVANLEGANLGGANLWGANLEGANLWGANLWGANLRGAKISENITVNTLIKLEYSNFEYYILLIKTEDNKIFAKIGCQCLPIDKWKKLWKTIAKNNGIPLDDKLKAIYKSVLAMAKTV